MAFLLVGELRVNIDQFDPLVETGMCLSWVGGLVG